MSMSGEEGRRPTAKEPADGKRIREEKQRKWQAKKEKLNQVPGAGEFDASSLSTDDSHAGLAASTSGDSTKRPRADEAPSLAPHVDRWIALKDYAHRISVGDLSEPDLEPYGNLRGDSHWVGRQGMFVAEGTETVRLLLQQVERGCSAWFSGDRKGLIDDEVIRVRSVVSKPSVLMDPPVRLVEDVEAAMRGLVLYNGTRENDEPHLPAFRVFVAEEKAQNQLTGYDGARGVMACGFIPRNRDEDWLVNCYLRRLSKGRLRLLAVDGVSDTSNLGSMIRSASAFGVDAIVLSHNTCDAWYRRCVRVSMGHVFRVPTVRVKQLASVLPLLWEKYEVVSYAAVLKDCDLVLERVERGTSRCALECGSFSIPPSSTIPIAIR